MADDKKDQEHDLKQEVYDDATVAAMNATLEAQKATYDAIQEAAKGNDKK